MINHLIPMMNLYIPIDSTSSLSHVYGNLHLQAWCFSIDHAEAPGTSGHLGRFSLDLFTMDPSSYVDLTQIDSAPWRNW